MTRLLQLGSIVLLTLLSMISAINFTSRDVQAAEAIGDAPNHLTLCRLSPEAQDGLPLGNFPLA